MTERTPDHDRSRARRTHADTRVNKHVDDDESRGSRKLRRRTRGDEERFDWRRSLDSDNDDD